MIEARILADSIGSRSPRLVTFHVKFHRYVLAEVNTHRVFSRNYRSSRAVPAAKLIQEVRENPVMPITKQANKPGMQGGEELDLTTSEICDRVWSEAAYKAADSAEQLMKLGLHKSWVNRVIEPYLYVYGVITSAHWANFFALRRHPDAQPEIKDLADKMYAAMQTSTPKQLSHGQWHLPFIEDRDHRALIEYACEHNMDWLTVAKSVSAARCARTSYHDFDGSIAPIEKDMELYCKLVVRDTMHASPLEHQATPDEPSEDDDAFWQRPSFHGNLTGWVQFRKTLVGEAVED